MLGQRCTGEYMVRSMGDQEASVSDEELGNAAISERLRRPVPERTAPHRGWQHLYTLGVAADAAASSLPISPPREDDAARVVRDGYRTLEENYVAADKRRKTCTKRRRARSRYEPRLAPWFLRLLERSSTQH